MPFIIVDGKSLIFDFHYFILLLFFHPLSCFKCLWLLKFCDMEIKKFIFFSVLFIVIRIKGLWEFFTKIFECFCGAYVGMNSCGWVKCQNVVFWWNLVKDKCDIDWLYFDSVFQCHSCCKLLGIFNIFTSILWKYSSSSLKSDISLEVVHLLDNSFGGEGSWVWVLLQSIVLGAEFCCLKCYHGG